MERLRHLTLEDLAQGLLRYRPAVATLAVIVAIVTLLPGGPVRQGGDDAATGPADLPAVFGEDRTDGGQQESDASASSRGGAFETAGGGAAATVSDGSTMSTRPPASSDYGGSYDSGPPMTTAASDEPGGSFRTSEPEPLTIREWAWATREAGTPLAAAGVPDGTLPVANRLGSVDKASFVRLQGDASTLRLQERAEGAPPSSGDPVVALCVVKDPGWAAGPAQSFEDAPEWTDQCATGTRGDDGVWTFELGVFDVDSRAGFALVPGPQAPLDFHVNFEQRAVEVG